MAAFDRIKCGFPRLDGILDLFPTICPDLPELSPMIAVKEPEGLCYWLDSVGNRAVCGFEG